MIHRPMVDGRPWYTTITLAYYGTTMVNIVAWLYYGSTMVTVVYHGITWDAKITYSV